MKQSTKEAFTLIELLVVLLLMGIVYALAFNYLMPKNGFQDTSDITLKTIIPLFKSAPNYGEKDIYLYCKEEGECILVSDMKIINNFTLKKSAKGYIVNPDETFQSIEYKHIKIENYEFRPSFIIRCKENGLFEPSIIRNGEKWHYIHPFGKIYTFLDPVTMVSFMRQSDFLPDRSGYAQ